MRLILVMMLLGCGSSPKLNSSTSRHNSDSGQALSLVTFGDRCLSSAQATAALRQPSRIVIQWPQNANPASYDVGYILEKNKNKVTPEEAVARVTPTQVNLIAFKPGGYVLTLVLRELSACDPAKVQDCRLNGGVANGLFPGDTTIKLAFFASEKTLSEYFDNSGIGKDGTNGDDFLSKLTVKVINDEGAIGFFAKFLPGLGASVGSGEVARQQVHTGLEIFPGGCYEKAVR